MVEKKANTVKNAGKSAVKKESRQHMIKKRYGCTDRNISGSGKRNFGADRSLFCRPLGFNRFHFALPAAAQPVRQFPHISFYNKTD